MNEYGYCKRKGTWIVTFHNAFLAYATDEEDARKTAKEYNEEDE
jgi:hypothetical protein